MKANKIKIQRILLHTMFCMLMFLTPLMFVNSDDPLSWSKYAEQLVSPLTLIFVFYVNYLFLAPRLLLKSQRIKFFILNTAIICGLAAGVHEWMEFTFRQDVKRVERRMTRKQRAQNRKKREHGPGKMFFFFRDVFNFSLAATTATAIILAGKWSEADKARQEAEAARTEAELKNLRSQINPHFLLNTLNNIYALTAFDPSKAQEAIIELSKLLRHVLYDNQQAYVLLRDEAQFIHSYVNLMKMRLPRSVDVQECLDFPDGCDAKIAPLIFISLIENAFKHGISPTEPSFIHIRLAAQPDCVVCDIRNSNYPKTQADRSGHGIGLQQVARRLDLAYPGQYKWEKSVSEDKKTYQSIITIYDNQMRNH